MDVYRVIPLRENLWAVSELEKTVLYVINGREKALLLDTGFGLVNLPELVRGLCGEKPVVVVNSHAHPDHNSGNNQFDAVWVGAFDEPESHAAPDEASREQSRAMFFEEFEKAGGTLPPWNPGPAPRVNVLLDGDVIDLGGLALRVIEAPGHTRGSIALFEETLGWLFTGDLILTWEVWGQLETSAALRVYHRSLERLDALRPRVTAVFPAHWDEKNPYGYPSYQLPPEVPSVCAEGTARTVDGRDEGVPYEFWGRLLRCAYFSVGGMVFDPDRIG